MDGQVLPVRLDDAARSGLPPTRADSHRTTRKKGGAGNVPKLSIVLDEEEQAELQVILVDRDGEAALNFLKEVVWAQVQAVRRKELRSHLEAGQG